MKVRYSKMRLKLYDDKVAIVFLLGYLTAYVCLGIVACWHQEERDNLGLNKFDSPKTQMNCC